MEKYILLFWLAGYNVDISGLGFLFCSFILPISVLGFVLTERAIKLLKEFHGCITIWIISFVPYCYINNYKNNGLHPNH